jgi:C-terminal processing protease CtpA/Prc
MINELDFSGGDFFPAILQDNKRVTLVGSRTSGAGGYVLPLKFTNSFGLEAITFTGSLAERVDKNPIENLGVTPDVPIEMTAKDYQTGFTDYVSKVKAVVSEKLK